MCVCVCVCVIVQLSPHQCVVAAVDLKQHIPDDLLVTKKEKAVRAEILVSHITHNTDNRDTCLHPSIHPSTSVCVICSKGAM